MTSGACVRMTRLKNFSKVSVLYRHSLIAACCWLPAPRNGAVHLECQVRSTTHHIGPKVRKEATGEFGYKRTPARVGSFPVIAQWISCTWYL